MMADAAAASTTFAAAADVANDAQMSKYRELLLRALRGAQTYPLTLIYLAMLITGRLARRPTGACEICHQIALYTASHIALYVAICSALHIALLILGRLAQRSQMDIWMFCAPKVSKPEAAPVASAQEAAGAGAINKLPRTIGKIDLGGVP